MLLNGVHKTLNSSLKFIKLINDEISFIKVNRGLYMVLRIKVSKAYDLTVDNLEGLFRRSLSKCFSYCY